VEDNDFLIKKVPQNYKENAKQLLKFVDDDKINLSWDRFGKVYINMEPIIGSDINTIFPKLFKKWPNKNDTPGLVEVMTAILSAGLGYLINKQNLKKYSRRKTQQINPKFHNFPFEVTGKKINGTILVLKMMTNDFKPILENIPALKDHFFGIFALDKIPELSKLPKRHFLIFNLSISTDKGSHWCCLLKNDTEIELFNSLGVSSLDNLKPYLKFPRHLKIRFNSKCYQDQSSDSCGLFVIYFLVERMMNMCMPFDELLFDIFTTDNTQINEQTVKQFCLNTF